MGMDAENHPRKRTENPIETQCIDMRCTDQRAQSSQTCARGRTCDCCQWKRDHVSVWNLFRVYPCPRAFVDEGAVSYVGKRLYDLLKF